MSAPRQRRSQLGYTLISVLWALATVSAIAFLALQAGREKVQVASNVVEAEKALALAEGGIALGRHALLGTTFIADWPLDGHLGTWNRPTGTITIYLSDEAGRIDLNTADPILLQSLFQTADMSPEAAARLSARIIDFRDADDDPELGGLETPQAELGNSGQTIDAVKNASFDHIRELMSVDGVTFELYSRVASALTVQSGAKGIDPVYAPRSALAALPGITPENIDTIQNMRADGVSANEIRQFVSSNPGASNLLTVSKRQYVRIISVGTSSAGVSQTVSAVVDVRRRSTALPPIVMWDENPSNLKP